MRLLRAFITLLCLAYFCQPASAATDSLRFAVRGSVRDAVGRPLETVSVSIPGTSYATITNKDGSFIIKSDTVPQTLSFSLLGYVTKTVQVTGSEMRVRLSSDDFTLDPARVVSGSPGAIVRYAVSCIQDNLPDTPELMDCFYRETVRKRQRYIYVSEAVTKTYKTAISNFWGRDRAAVVKSRLLTSPRKSDTLSVKVLGGPVMSAELDFVKTGAILLNTTDLDLYSYEMLPQEVIDGRKQFVIAFSPLDKKEASPQYGTYYIDSQTFAFTRIETSLDVSDPDKATAVILVKRPPGLRFKPREVSLRLDYKPGDDGKYRLSYLRTRIRFFCDWRKRLFATDFTATSEMVVTNIHSGEEAVPIPREEQFKSSESLADKTLYYADSDFWKDYNIIEPSTSLKQAFTNLKKTED